MQSGWGVDLSLLGENESFLDIQSMLQCTQLYKGYIRAYKTFCMVFYKVF